MHLKNPEDFLRHPWSGFHAENTHAGDEFAIEQEFEILQTYLQQACDIELEFCSKAGNDVSLCPHIIEEMNGTLPECLSAPDQCRLPEILESLLDPEAAKVVALVIEMAMNRQQLILEASKILSPGIIANSDTAKWLIDACAIAEGQQMGAFEIAMLHEKLPYMIEMSELLQSAVSIVARLEKIGLGSPSTLQDLAKYSDRIRICASAPQEVEKALSRKHTQPNTTSVLASARAASAEIVRQRDVVGNVFAIKDVPNSQTLANLKRTLKATSGSIVVMPPDKARES